MSSSSQAVSKSSDQSLVEPKAQVPVKPRCGLVMPISKCEGLSESHWLNVKEILTDSVRDAGFEAELVSAADDIGIIQKRIIENLYSNPMVVCDISCRNPNVMFELGLRLAFDKPTIIVKDDATQYSFDTSPIEHLNYPRDLRFNSIVEFKKELTAKVKGTYARATTDKNFTTFLKHFGTFTVAKLDTKEVTTEQFISQEMKEMREMLAVLVSRSQVEVRPRPAPLLNSPNASSRFRDQLNHAIKMAEIEAKEEIGAITIDSESYRQFCDRVVRHLKKIGVAMPQDELVSLVESVVRPLAFPF